MYKRIFFINLILAFFSSPLFAKIHPLATINLGGDYVHHSINQDIVFIPPFADRYHGNVNEFRFVGGFFLGLELPVTDKVLGQIGFSFYQNDPFQFKGTIDQLGDPENKNLGYYFKIQNQRFYAEGKLLTLLKNGFRPFISAAVGQTNNKASQYKEYPLDQYAVIADEGFPAKTSSNFSYLLGIGVEKDLSQHVRLGASYRWVGLNQVRLGNSFYQESSIGLGIGRFYANEFLLQLSILG